MCENKPIEECIFTLYITKYSFYIPFSLLVESSTN